MLSNSRIVITSSNALGAHCDSDVGIASRVSTALETLWDNAGTATASKALGALSDDRTATVSSKALGALWDNA